MLSEVVIRGGIIFFFPSPNNYIVETELHEMYENDEIPQAALIPRRFIPEEDANSPPPSQARTMLAFPPPCLRCSVLALLGWARLEAEGSARGATDDVKTPAATTAMAISSATTLIRKFEPE